MRILRVVVLAVTANLSRVPPLSAQAEPNAATADGASLRGTVTASASGPTLPYAIVSIPALKLERFANQRGEFVFTRLHPGKYPLLVRQLGYAPGSVDVVIVANNATEISVQLTRLPQTMAAMTVKADWDCKKAGAPKNAPSATLVALEQLKQNADRMRLLQQEYPFEVRAERWQVMRAMYGPDSLLRLDTITIAQPQAVMYQPGRVMYNVTETDNTEGYFTQVPTLLDFVDREFQRNHCFAVQGVDDAHGGLLRIDFKPLSKLSSTDIGGSVFLDPNSYLLQSAEFRLTFIPKDLVGTESFGFTTMYAELSPGLPVVAGVHAVTILDPAKFHNNYFQTVEEQTPISVRFLKQRPDSTPR